MEAPEAAGPLAGVGMRGWRMTPRAAPLGDEPVAQMENKVSAKGTEQALSTPFHLWGHVPCPQARMAIGQTEPLAPTATRSGQEVQAGGETHWHVSSPAQTFRRSWGQRTDRSPFILSLLLLLHVWASLAAWHPGGHRENPQQEKPWSSQGHYGPNTPSHAGPVAGDTCPLSPGSPGVLVPCTRPHHHMHTAKHSPQQSPWRLSCCPPL